MPIFCLKLQLKKIITQETLFFLPYPALVTLINIKLAQV